MIQRIQSIFLTAVILHVVILQPLLELIHRKNFTILVFGD